MDTATRAQSIANLSQALDAIEAQAHPTGPYLVGQTVTYADAAAFPTLYFMHYMLPRYFGWPGIFRGRPRLGRWWEVMGRDADVARVLGEIDGAF